MADASVSVQLISWTIPTPRGLWHRAIVLTAKGLFITPELDAVSMESIKAATDQDPDVLLELLAGHGRFKRCDFLGIQDITGLAANKSAGTIRFSTAESETQVRVPDRDQLSRISLALKQYVQRARH